MSTAVFVQYSEPTAQVAEWTSLAQAETGLKADVHRWVPITFQLTGTFGTGTVAIQGSLDGVSWVNLNSDAGASLAALGATTLANIRERVRFVRPVITGGDGTTALKLVIAGIGQGR